MDLVEALRVIGPLVGDRAIDRVRNAAMVVVHREVEALKRHLPGASDPQRDDAAQVALLKLMHMRVPDHEAPMSEKGARAYVATTLRNAFYDLHRKDTPKVRVADGKAPEPAKFVHPGSGEAEISWDSLAADDETPESILLEKEQAPRPPLERLRAMVLDEIAPRVAATLGGKVRADFEQTIAEIRAMKRGECTVADVIASERRDDPADTFVKARNRYYARKARACRRLHVFLLEMCAAGDVAEKTATLLRNVIDEAIKD